LGYTAGAIDRACFEAAGFTVADLKRCGFMAADMRRLGYSAADLKQAGYALTHLACAGYSGDNLLDAGFRFDDVLACIFEDSEYQLVCCHLHTFTRSRAHARNRKKMMTLDGNRKKRRARLPEDHWVASEGQEPGRYLSVSSEAASNDDDVQWAELAYLASFVQRAESGYPDSF